MAVSMLTSTHVLRSSSTKVSFGKRGVCDMLHSFPVGKTYAMRIARKYADSKVRRHCVAFQIRNRAGM